jgi:hypothetical protein
MLPVRRIVDLRGTTFSVLAMLVLTWFFAASSVAQTPLTTLRRQTRNLLRHEATAKNATQKDDAVTALCDLYVLIRQDDRYESSEMLQQDATKIRRRLLSVATDRKNQLKRDEVTRPASLSSEVDAALEAAIKSPQEDYGKIGKMAFQGAQAAGAFDNGWQLVELIQRIVAPDFWDAQGGPGTIRYFGIRRVLVVRATSDVHEQIRELLLRL